MAQVAVDAYGAVDEELWIKYLQSRIVEGRSFGDIYWRATKALQDPQSFVQRCQSMSMLMEQH